MPITSAAIPLNRNNDNVSRNSSLSDPFETLNVGLIRRGYSQGLTRLQLGAGAASVLPDSNPVETLLAYCLGREAQTDSVGAVARFFRDGPNAFCRSVADLRTLCNHCGPNVTQQQITDACTAAGVSPN